VERRRNEGERRTNVGRRINVVRRRITRRRVAVDFARTTFLRGRSRVGAGRTRSLRTGTERTGVERTTVERLLAVCDADEAFDVGRAPANDAAKSVKPKAMTEDFIERQVFHVDAESVGVRVDAYLSQTLHVSRSRAQKILETALLNGLPAKPKVLLRLGDSIEVQPFEREENPFPAASLDELKSAPDVPIVYEDADLLVINKPRGLTVHAGAGETGATLVDVLRAMGKPLSSVGPPERAGIVHRLDKDTSGLMMVALTDAAHWKLAADFEARRVHKRYLALLNGVPSPRGRIEAAITRSNSNRTKMTVAPGGRLAITEYEIEKAWPKFALVSINLLTGRTHQIRVHFNYLTHPIVGDAVYGGLHRALTCAPSERAKNAIEALDGQALHSQTLHFEHPISGEPMSFEAAPPPVFADVLDALEEAS